MNKIVLTTILRRLIHRNGAIPSWDLGKGWHGEWDSQHGEIEVYNKKGEHQGAYDPETGEKTKDPVRGRKPTYKSVAMDALKAKAPDLELKVLTVEDVLREKGITLPAQQTPEQAEEARKQAISEAAGRNPWGWSTVILHR